MTRFPSAKQLASWVGMCPGHDESGGKRLRGKLRQGSRWLRQTLDEVAHVASKTRQTYLAARRGKKRALMAAGHTILSLVYTSLTRKPPYRDLGATYVDTLDQHRVERRLVQRPEGLGYQVSLQPRVA